MTPENEAELFAMLRHLVGKVDGLSAKIDAVESNLSARIDAVDAKLSAKIDAVESNLSARIDAVDAKIEELRRVTSVNHHRVIGRIEGLESMLAAHMTDTDAHLPTPRKRH
ncbi:MAG: hypothetical protein WCF85_01780 [Rhodospirillaceae bacterium]